MPGPNYSIDKGFYIDAATTQFYAQKLVTGSKEHVTQASTLGDACIGIIQESVTAAYVTNGRIADVRIAGISRAVAGGAVTIGARVRAAASGKLVALAAATAKQEVVGIAMTAAAADGDHFDVFLTLGAQADVA